MNILMAHSHYQIPGGEDESFRTEAEMLRRAGHEVTTYAVHNEELDRYGPVRQAGTTVWSHKAYRDVRALLRRSGAEIVHVQNFFPLISPSIYYAARAEGVPVVQSLRNYRLLCPNGLFFRDGHPCEDCLGKRVQLPGIVHRCYRDSAPASAAVAAMNLAHGVAGTWSRMVDTWIALTEFTRQKYIEGGWQADRIVVKPNAVDPDPGLATGPRSGMIFAGRLSREKGLATLLTAWERLGTDAPPLRILGDGPLRAAVEQAAATLPTVEYLGRRRNREMLDLVGQAAGLIMPSEWYETFGRVIIEAYAKGTPVIATRIGAIAGNVEHGRTGLLYEPGDVAGLVAAVRRATGDGAAWRVMGDNARARYVSTYTAAHNVAHLLDIYTATIERRHGVRRALLRA